jgi:hypothetical protein
MHGLYNITKFLFQNQWNNLQSIIHVTYDIWNGFICIETFRYMLLEEKMCFSTYHIAKKLQMTLLVVNNKW